MAAVTGTIPPPISWAQRMDLLYVIIDVECKDIEHKVTENTFHFKGVNALEADKKYEVTLNFLHPVNPDRVTSKNIGRCLEFTIYKKEAGPYWTALTNDKTKLHFLKANFAKWKNESDDEEEMDNNDPFAMMNSGMNWNKKFDDFNVDDDDEEDSDDNIPSLSQNDDEDEQQENTSAAGGDKPENVADKDK